MRYIKSRKGDKKESERLRKMNRYLSQLIQDLKKPR